VQLNARKRPFQALDQLTEYPRVGKPFSRRMREDHVPFGKHGYILRYQVRPGEIWISRIYHGAQDRFAG